MAAKKRRRGAGEPVMSMSDVAAEVRYQSPGWEFGETSLSTMSESDAKAHLGLQVDPGELQAMEVAIRSAAALEAFATVSAPSAIDWRSNGGNFVTSVKDQGGCGSCVSFASIATIEARTNIACRTPGVNRDYSEAFLFSCGCGTCCGSGWNFAPALSFCQSTGFAAESAFPYTPGDQPCRTGVPILDKITGFATILGIVDRKNAIASGGPVVAGMAVHQDFYGYRNGVYRHVSGGLSGYHAVSVVGYSDPEGCWIAKNSWNTTWGMGGFFKIAYGECGMDTQFAMYAPSVRCPPTNQCEQGRTMLLRVLQAARTNPRLRSCLRYYVCRRVAVRPYCGASELDVVRLVLRILQICPQYRVPFCNALG